MLLFTFLLLAPPLYGQDVCLPDPSKPSELYAIADHEVFPLEMAEDDVFELFGEENHLVKDAFLSPEPSCHHRMRALRKLRARKPWLVEYGMKKGPMESLTGRTTYFFCTSPVSAHINSQVTLKKARSDNKQVLYFFLPLLAVTLCMSATFSGLNLAIMSFSINDLKLIQESESNPKNRRRAGDVLRLRRRSNFTLCTIVCGNCFCNTSTTVLINHFGETFGFSEYFFVELIATALLLIFTEILPALICTKNALYVASKLQYLVIFTMFLTFPVSYPLSTFLDCILGKDDADDSPVHVETPHPEGKRESKDNDDDFDEMDVVKNTFDLRYKTAGDVMTRIEKVTMVDCDKVLSRDVLLSKIFGKGHSLLPVYQGNNNNIVGVLNLKDFLLVLDDPAKGIDSQITASTLLRLLQKRKKHSFVLDTTPVQRFMGDLQEGSPMAIVVKFDEKQENEDEATYTVKGIVTLEDIMELVVGDIKDEMDQRRDKRTTEKRKIK